MYGTKSIQSNKELNIYFYTVELIYSKHLDTFTTSEQRGCIILVAKFVNQQPYEYKHNVTFVNPILQMNMFKHC